MCDSVDALQAVVERAEKAIDKLSNKHDKIMEKLQDVENRLTRVEQSVSFLRQNVEYLQDKSNTKKLAPFIDVNKIIQALVGAVVALAGYLAGKLN